MHADLVDVIKTSKTARNDVIARKMAAKDANAVSGLNRAIVSAHSFDLRDRIFAASFGDTDRSTQPQHR